MKTAIRCAIAAACMLSCSLLNAETFTLANGERFEATVVEVKDNLVTFESSDATQRSHSLDSLDPASKATLESWIQDNPDKVNVYDAWDTKPVVLRSKAAVTPPQLCTPGFKGVVSLLVTLDERGRVLNSTVSKSTHSDLEEAAKSAMKDWQFKPAKIDGEQVKAKIAISFQFKA